MAELVTQEMIAEGMARAEKGACSPGDDRCYLLPDPLDEVRASCTPMGRCRIAGAPEGALWPTRGAIVGTSGSMGTPARGGCGARRGERTAPLLLNAEPGLRRQRLATRRADRGYTSVGSPASIDARGPGGSVAVGGSVSTGGFGLVVGLPARWP